MPASNLCEVCGIKPKFVDATGTHPYCGKTCARNAVRIPGTGAPGGCIINGCKKPENGVHRGFCSSDHAKLAVSSGIVPGCTRCHILPQRHGQLCNRCAKPAPLDEIKMRNVSTSGTVWQEFEREWKDRWKTGTATTIDKLFEISYPPTVLASKGMSRNSLESGGGVQLLRTFHASQCICDMGTKGTVLCDWHSCGICNIVKSAFERIAFGAAGSRGKDGVGLYSSLDPSVADRFATSCLSSPYRAMIACDVVLPQNPSKNNSILMGDRVVVRNSGTITPRFIVMYTKGS